MTALAVFRRARAPVRIALAIAIGAVGISYAGMGALITFCILTGDCM